MFSTVFKCLCFFLMISNAINAASKNIRSLSNVTQSVAAFNSSSDPLVRALSSDNNEQQANSIGREVNGNVEFVKAGLINLTVPGKQLQLEVCKETCLGDYHICYDAKPGSINPKAAELCPGMQSYCGFKIKGDTDTLFIYQDGQDHATPQHKSDLVACSSPIVKYSALKVYTDAPGCTPNIDENGMLKIQVMAVDRCNIPVVGAKIKYPDISAIETDGTVSISKASSANFFTKYWWIFLIVGCVIFVIAGIAALIIGFLCYRKRRSSKKAAAAPLPITVEDNVPVAGTVQEEFMPASAVAAKLTQPKAECEPSSIPPKTEEPSTVQKPPKTEEPSVAEVVVPPPPKPSAEKVPPPTVPSAEAAPVPPPKPLPPPQPQPVAPAAVPKAADASAKSSKKRKSRYTDSLSETRKLNRLLPVENIVESLRRDSVPQFDYPLYDVITKDYMHINNRPITEYEVDILCIPIGPMFAKIEAMSTECEKELAAMGVTFDEENRIYSMSPTAREFLSNPSTPSTIIYFAFGAEYHQYVTDARNIMAKYSTPLLYAVALQPRFSVYSRRKALSYIRRTLPFIRESYTAAERTRLPYPACAIEQAFQKNPEYFLSLDGIETFSEEIRKRQKKEKDTAEAAARKETSKKKEKDTVAAAPKQPSKKKSKKR